MRATPTTMTNLMMTTLVSQQLWSGLLSMPGTFQMPPSQLDETLVNWPNGSDTSPMGEPYSTPRTMGPGISPMPSNYLPPLTSPMIPPLRASLDGSSMPSPAPPPPPTLPTQPLIPPSTGAPIK